jgi:hypothetical protein
MSRISLEDKACKANSLSKSGRKISNLASLKKDNGEPKLVYLTNKAGAFANPLASEFDAWAAIGWYKV